MSQTQYPMEEDINKLSIYDMTALLKIQDNDTFISDYEMYAILAKMSAMEKVIMQGGKTDEPDILALQQARLAFGENNRSQQIYEAKLKLQEAAALCGTLPPGALQRIFPSEIWVKILVSMSWSERRQISRWSMLLDDELHKWKNSSYLRR